MDTKSLIFSTIVESAYASVFPLSEDQSYDDAIEQVSEEFNLTAAERSALVERVKKTIQPPETTSAAEDMVVSEPDDADALKTDADGNFILFDNEEDLDQATGILMYKGIPWQAKEKDAGCCRITFDDQTTLKEAQAVLKRRYDFVESTTRKVGIVEFDNLADYSKVLEYMKRQGMMIECNEGATLDEDAEIQEALAIELGEDASAVARGYSARSKNSEAVNLDVFENASARSVTIRKRWK